MASESLKDLAHPIVCHNASLPLCSTYTALLLCLLPHVSNTLLLPHGLLL